MNAFNNEKEGKQEHQGIEMKRITGDEEEKG